MAVARVGSWSTISNGDPTGSLTIGSGSDRLFVLIVTSESSDAWSITDIDVGGEDFTAGYQETYDAFEDVNVSIFVWDESGIGAMSGSSVTNYTHTGTDIGQNWQYATFSGIDQTTPVTQFTAQNASIDSLDVTTTSNAGDFIVLGAARNVAARDFTDWDSLTEIEDNANGEGYRHGIADGSGGDNTTTVVGDGTNGSMLLNALVLNEAVSSGVQIFRRRRS